METFQLGDKMKTRKNGVSRVKIVAFLAVAAFLALGYTAVADAVPIGPSCATCFGSTYDINFLLLSETATTQTFQIVLTIDTTGYTGNTNNVLNDVAVKVADPAHYVSGNLISSPATYQELEGGVSQSGTGGCAAGNNGFDCANFTGLGGGLGVGSDDGGIYNWVFNITVDKGFLLDGVNEASIKALYLTSSGGNAGITSESITIPEPSTLLLLGSGLLGLGVLGRYYRKQD